MAIDTIDSLIQKFQFPETSETDTGKQEIIIELESMIKDSRVIPFYLKILSDKNEDDLARIEICKILGCCKKNDSSDRDNTALVLLEILNGEPDSDVRGYAIIASQLFLNYPRIINRLCQIAEDRSESQALRDSAFMTIIRGGKSKDSISLMQNMLKDDVFRKVAVDTLREWHEN